MLVRNASVFGAILASLVISCGGSGPAESEAPAKKAAPAPIAAELIGSNPGWGNTEGPAVDSKGTLYFTSRGTFKGIVAWTAADGASEYMAVATGAGPGGLWIDDADNIYATATDERQILKISPSKKVTVLASNFEASPDVSKGPNDIAVSSGGTVYFTAPNGYDGSAPKGTIYRIDTTGNTTVFSDEVTGPNGIVAGKGEQHLYVSHNIDAATSKIVRWALKADGSRDGVSEEVATVAPCVADGMTVDADGNLWLTCYSYGTAYLVTPSGEIVQTVTTEQKALTNAVFGRGSDNHSLYLSSSDMERVTGYIYRATVGTPGER